MYRYDGVRIHYPSLLQLDDARVLVMYSRFYLGKCGAPSQEQLNKNYGKFKAGSHTRFLTVPS
jgi:hypothetical protein